MLENAPPVEPYDLVRFADPKALGASAESGHAVDISIAVGDAVRTVQVDATGETETMYGDNNNARIRRRTTKSNEVLPV